MADGTPLRRVRVALTYVPITLGLCAMVYAFGFGIRSWQDFWDAFRPAAGPVLAPLVITVFIGLLRLRVSRKLSDFTLGVRGYVGRLLPELERERALGVSERESGADDASLVRAHDHARMAALYVEEAGSELEAVHELELLLAEVETWERSSAPARAAKRLRRVVKQGQIIRRRVDIEVRRDGV